MRKRWTEENTIAVLNLYHVTPFGRLDEKNHEVIALAEKIGHSPSSVALKLGNFAALDPNNNHTGMRNASKLDQKVWDEFKDGLTTGKRRSKPWTEEELVLTLKLYYATTFGRLHRRNPDIIALAEKIDRTPSSVALKLGNFAALDPALDRAGMGNASKLDREVWDKFLANIDDYLAEETELLDTTDNETEQPLMEQLDGIGRDVLTTSKQRVGQQKFRNAILTLYDGRCAISGIKSKHLLRASHIVRWADDVKHRLNPRNGICLNALLDAAFDRGLLSLSDNLEILLSDSLSGHDREKLLSAGRVFRPPERFAPDRALLQKHREEHKFE